MSRESPRPPRHRSGPADRPGAGKPSLPAATAPAAPPKRQPDPAGRHQPPRHPSGTGGAGAAAPSSRSIRQKERFDQLKARRKAPEMPAGQADDDEDDDLDERLDRLANRAAGNDSDEAPAWDPERVQAQAEMFANRLRKRRQHLWKWARRTGTSCFRIYDRDIPELPFQVDEYERHLHIAQIVRVRSSDEEHARLWTETMVEAASRALGVEKSRVFVKNRLQQKGSTQYDKSGSAGFILKVTENGMQFELNMSDYLDTGLFLDHRDTRAMVGSLSLGARVLNLFAYTGSFSVYAARGGALSTTSVDLSNTYTQWAERNLALNGFGGKLHKCINEDVLKWIPEAVERHEQFDIIICDPPTFSNSKKMEGVFDVQRDHPWLINQLLRLLTRNGIIVFSNNFRKFKLDMNELRTNYVDDITFKSIPEDFKGKKPHKCYVIKRDS